MVSGLMSAAMLIFALSAHAGGSPRVDTHKPTVSTNTYFGSYVVPNWTPPAWLTDGIIEADKSKPPENCVPSISPMMKPKTTEPLEKNSLNQPLRTNEFTYSSNSPPSNNKDGSNEELGNDLNSHAFKEGYFMQRYLQLNGQDTPRLIGENGRALEFIGGNDKTPPLSGNHDGGDTGGETGLIQLGGMEASLQGTSGIALLEFAKDGIQTAAANAEGIHSQSKTYESRKKFD